MAIRHKQRHPGGIIYIANAAWRPDWKMAALANIGTISSASISEIVYDVIIYVCANFDVFIKK